MLHRAAFFCRTIIPRLQELFIPMTAMGRLCKGKLYMFQNYLLWTKQIFVPELQIISLGLADLRILELVKKLEWVKMNDTAIFLNSLAEEKILFCQFGIKFQVLITLQTTMPRKRNRFLCMQALFINHLRVCHAWDLRAERRSVAS